jgi:DNA-3-methyladenine glycosylase
MGSWQPVQPSFFDRPTEQLGPLLLDLILVRHTADGLVAGRIVECEVYRGPSDRAAHSYGGRVTERTRVMYGPPGFAYIYLIYGMYHCLNVVTGPPGAPEAILIRALAPLAGVERMAGRSQDPRHRIAAGPGKVCRALKIDRQFYGHPLWEPPLFLAPPQQPWPAYQVAQGPRIGIDYAEEARSYPWRFWVYNHPSVSVKGTVTRVVTPAV